MDNYKKKRSPNYTMEEKENLLAILAKYQSVIECKRTGAYYIKKKQEAWKSICKEYNSLSTTGPRHETMLKHFYNNIKHRARKDSANENKERYLNTLSDETNIVEVCHPPQYNQTEQDVDVLNDENVIVVNEPSIKDLKKKLSNEQKNLKKTGGGSFTPTLNDADHQILSILDDQIRPNENPFDEAAEYFGEKIEVIYNPEPESNPLPDPPKPVPVLRKRKLIPKRKNMIKDSLSHTKHSAEALKKMYFKKKIELTYYQKRNEMQKFRFQQKKHEMEIQILKKQLQKAERDLM